MELLDVNKLDEDITVSTYAMFEEIPYIGNASAINEKTDKKVIEWIESQLDNGNILAWCLIRVNVENTKLGLSADGHLGCCSYENINEFKGSGYYEDLIQECLTDIKTQQSQKKSEYASHVLQLMDRDYCYESAVNLVVDKFREDLHIELDKYI